LLDGAAPDANLQLYAVIEVHSARAASTYWHSRKVYRDVGGSLRDDSNYDAVEIDDRARTLSK
jgi:hypothetical protein